MSLIINDFFAKTDSLRKYREVIGSTDVLSMDETSLAFRVKHSVNYNNTMPVAVMVSVCDAAGVEVYGRFVVHVKDFVTLDSSDMLPKTLAYNGQMQKSFGHNYDPLQTGSVTTMFDVVDVVGFNLSSYDPASTIYYKSSLIVADDVQAKFNVTQDENIDVVVKNDCSQPVKTSMCSTGNGGAGGEIVIDYYQKN